MLGICKVERISNLLIAAQGKTVRTTPRGAYMLSYIKGYNIYTYRGTKVVPIYTYYTFNTFGI